MIYQYIYVIIITDNNRQKEGTGMLKIAIVDDEEIFVTLIQKKVFNVLERLRVECKIYTFTDSIEMLHESTKHHFDLLFLDIDMPNITGLDIARKLRLKNIDTEVIFVTNKDELVYDTFQYGPFRFIRKSRFDSEIEEALQNFVKKVNHEKISIFLSTENGKKPVKVLDIMYIEVQSHKLTVHMSNSMISANGNLNDLETEIRKYGFIRIHKSYLVNYRAISFIHQKKVIIDDGTALPLSRRKFEYTQNELMRFSREL